MNFGLVFVGVFFPFLSLAGALNLRKAWLIGSASNKWPCVTGRITESRFDHDDGSYNLIINYEYAVNGKRLQGNTYSYRGHSTDLRTVEDIVIRYRANSNVEVHYDPKNCETSLLVPGVDQRSFVTASIVLSILLIVGLLCLGCAFGSFGLA